MATTRRSGTARRFPRLAWLAILLVGLGIGARFAAPPLLQSWVQGRIVQEIQRRNLPLTLGGFTLGATRAQIAEACLQLPPLPEAIACADVLVEFARPHVFSTDIRLTGLHITRVRVNATAEQGTLEDIRRHAEAWVESIRPARREPTDPVAEAAAARRRRPDLPDLTVTDVEVALEGQGLPLEGLRLTGVQVIWQPGSSVPRLVQGEVSARGLQPPAWLRAPGTLDITYSQEADEAWSVVLTPDVAMGVQGPGGLSAYHATVQGLAFTWPYHLSAQELVVGVPGQTEPLLAAPTVTLSLRDLPRSLEDLYMTELVLQHPRFHVAMGSGGDPLFMVPLRLIGVGSGSRSASPGPSVADAGEVGLDAGEGSGTTEEAAPAPPRPRGLWARRRWWEKIPQRIALHDARLDIPARVSGHGLRLEDLDLTWAVRVFQQQADVELQGTLTRMDGSEVGPIALTAIWFWQREALRANLALPPVDLQDVFAVATGTLPEGLSGRIGMTLEVDELPRGPDLQVAGSLDVQDLRWTTSLLQTPVEVPSLQVTWRARQESASPGLLVFEEGDVRLGEARASFRPRLHGFDLLAPRPWGRTEIEVEVPDQDADLLFHALPAALLGPLAEARLGGVFGYSARWAFELQRADDGWLYPGALEETRGLQFRDQGMRLEHLPSSMDVRRMNGAFDFIFHGPQNRFERPIHVPQPRPAGGEDVVLPAHWVRLSDISWYLIAVQLYREDGRFFDNHGINWFQLRRVTEEALAARRLGRGASTITMQVVKNVFLTHERHVERKVTELFLAYWMTRLVPKERILEVYLNVIEFGPQLNGVVEAARWYFGRHPRDLTFAEATWLSAITPAPARRAPQRDLGRAPDWMVRQVRDLMRGVAGRGLVTRQELAEGLAQEIWFVTGRRPEPDPWAASDDPAAGPEGSGSADDPGSPGEAPPVAPLEEDDPGPQSDLLRRPPLQRVQVLIDQALPLRP
jgi:hypothetical protein